MIIDRYFKRIAQIDVNEDEGLQDVLNSVQTGSPEVLADYLEDHYSQQAPDVLDLLRRQPDIISQLIATMVLDTQDPGRYMTYLAEALEDMLYQAIKPHYHGQTWYKADNIFSQNISLELELYSPYLEFAGGEYVGEGKFQYEIHTNGIYPEDPSLMLEIGLAMDDKGRIQIEVFDVQVW